MLQSCEMFVPAQVPVAFALSIEVVSPVVIDMGCLVDKAAAREQIELALVVLAFAEFVEASVDVHPRSFVDASDTVILEGNQVNDTKFLVILLKTSSGDVVLNILEAVHLSVHSVDVWIVFPGCILFDDDRF